MNKETVTIAVVLISLGAQFAWGIYLIVGLLIEGASLGEIIFIGGLVGLLGWVLVRENRSS